MRTLILDLKNLAFRAAWTHQKIVDQQGRPAGGIYGILRMLTSALHRFPDVNRLVLACDPLNGSTQSWRSMLYPDYKVYRTSSSDEQIELRRSVMENLRTFRQIATCLPCLWMEDRSEEADDLIAWFVAHTRAHEMVTILSRDWDLMQLAAYPNVTVAYPDKGGFHLLMANNFPAAIDPLLRQRAKNSRTWPNDLVITPRVYLVMKSWIGDKSDGITGLPRVKELTAAKMLAKIVRMYGQDAIPAHPRAAFQLWWQACKASPRGPLQGEQALAAHPNALEIIARNYQLILLLNKTDVSPNRDGFRGTFDETVLADWLKHFRFNSLLTNDGQISPHLLEPLRKLTHA